MKPTVAICTPARDEVSAVYHECMVAMVMHSMRSGATDALGHMLVRGSSIPMNRTVLIRRAVKAQATHLLFIDSDMSFPKDALDRLLAHDKDIVAANCVKKQTPNLFVACGLDGHRLVTHADDSGLVECTFAGMAMILIATSVFQHVTEPWFDSIWVPSRDEYMSEDVAFCLKARRAGITMWIDHDISKEMGHVGQHTYTASSVPEFAAARQAEKA